MSIACLAVGGCTTLEGLLAGSTPAQHGARAPALETLPLEDAIDPNRFVIELPLQSVIGVPQVVFTNTDDTLPDLALAYGIGYDELLAANPGVDPWLPGEHRAILLPTQFVLPDGIREGLVLNIASKRLFYFPADGIERDPTTNEITSQTVLSFPIGIGRIGWETPLGTTRVVAKAKDPTWWVPASVRKEHAAMGDPLPSVVPPGPDNPLGTRVLKLDMPGYLIHGTNQPYGVGMRVSHGCVRLYPENIELLYELVDVGEPVTIINEPYQLGQLNGEWYFESHAPLADDSIDPGHRLDEILQRISVLSEPGLPDHVRAIAAASTGMAVRIAALDETEVLARVRRVKNTIAADPEAPTLAEVREMIDAAVAEAKAETDD